MHQGGNMSPPSLGIQVWGSYHDWMSHQAGVTKWGDKMSQVLSQD